MDILYSAVCDISAQWEGHSVLNWLIDIVSAYGGVRCLGNVTLFCEYHALVGGDRKNMKTYKVIKYYMEI